MMNAIRSAWSLLVVYILSAPFMQAQQDIHLIGVMPTLDVGRSIGEGWYIENYSFACILPVEQSRPSFSSDGGSENYGPGGAVEEMRDIRALVFAYSELDVTRSFNESWSVTGSYTHEWVPKNAGGSSVSKDRYTRNEHRVWLQAKYRQDAGSFKWWWRMRWDQRLIENNPYALEDKAWSWRPRLREQLGFEVPLKNSALVLSTEAFVEAWSGAKLTSSNDLFREAWTSLQYSRQWSERMKWEVGPMIVSWKQLDGQGSLGWAHYWYLQSTLFLSLTR